jgi:hypothetical protein
MPRAIPLLLEKNTDVSGNTLDVTVWLVPVSEAYPNGVRYRLAFIRRDEKSPIVLYDNHAPKGDHRHVEGIELPYQFTALDDLVRDFLADVRTLTGEMPWPGR